MTTRAKMGPQAHRRDNFFYLLAALMILTVMGPVLEESLGPVGAFLAEVSLSITLVTALWSLRSSRRVFSSGLALIAVNILATAAWLLLNHEPASLLSDLSGLAFLALTTWAAGRELFRPGPVDPNKIVGALCVYVLIGVIWAMLYQLLEGFQPGSFSGLVLISSVRRRAAARRLNHCYWVDTASIILKASPTVKDPGF